MGISILEEPSAFIFRVEEMNRVWKTVYNIGKEELGLELWENQWQSVALKISPFSLQKKEMWEEERISLEGRKWERKYMSEKTEDLWKCTFSI